MAACSQVLRNANGYAVREGEYLDGEMIKCAKCNGEKLLKLEINLGSDEKPDFPWVRTACKCDMQKEEARKKKRVVNELEQNSGLGEKFKNAKFSNTDVLDNDFQRIFSKCFNFCQELEINLNKGRGMYIWGDVGTGKTHLASCIVNYVIKKNIRARLLTFSDISKEIKRTFGKSDETQYDYIRKLTNIPLLVIDDIGTEAAKKNKEDTWLQGQIFDVIEHRNKNNKSTIFTSNYTLEQLVKNRGFLKKTVDRINEMSTYVCYLSGESYRNKLVGK